MMSTVIWPGTCTPRGISGLKQNSGSYHYSLRLAISICRHLQTGHLPNAEGANKYVVRVANYYFKLAKGTPTTRKTTTRMANIFTEHWVASFGIRSIVLTDNGPDFTSKFLAAICKDPGIETATTTKYHPPTNGQIQRFNTTMI